jgi:hypothetical protein
MKQLAQKSCNFLLWGYTLSIVMSFPVGKNFIRIGIMTGNEGITGMVGRHVYRDGWRVFAAL